MLDKNLRCMYVALPIIECSLVIAFLTTLWFAGWYKEDSLCHHDFFTMLMLGAMKILLPSVEVC